MKNDWIKNLDEGIRLFNEGQFFECHEVLEDLWIEDRSEYRELIQGLIKVAVAFYHVKEDNVKGAVKVLSNGLQQLEPYVGRETPVELDTWIVDLGECLDLIKAGKVNEIVFSRIKIRLNDFHNR